jgi:hypothetical protein
MGKSNRIKVANCSGRIAMDPHSTDVDVAQFRASTATTLFEPSFPNAKEILKDVVGALICRGCVNY